LRRLEGNRWTKTVIHLNMEAERTKNYTLAATVLRTAENRRKNSLGEKLSRNKLSVDTRHLELAGFSLCFQ